MILKILKAVWNFWASIKLSIVLCFLLALDTALAYPLIKMNLTTFIPLGEVGIFTWLETYGRYNLGHTLWFFILMVLLTFLAINTFVCATEKLWHLLRQYNYSAGLKSLILKLGPHVMHYAVLVILLGYLGSYALSESLPGRSLTPDGLPIKLPRGQGELTLSKVNPVVYSGSRLDFFDTWYLDPGYVLTYTDREGNSESKALAYSKSPSFAGYRFYLADFYPKRNTGGGMGLNYIKLSIRKDPSAYVYIGGLILFVIGLGMYAADIFLRRKKKSSLTLAKATEPIPSEL
ncbi:MAG: hypothetical protein LBE38_10910 [Deltaproteobacteria bacterium]|jgi:hypothetical protein|nr:hypothetical protein [Deltaproteobacteria bacterium]